MRSLLLAALLPALAACNTDNCNDIVTDVGDICLPTAVAPEIESSIDIRELCGPGCTRQPSCNATLRNGSVVLDVSQELCSDAFSFSCAAAPCLQRLVRCKLPALTPGDYTLIAPGAPKRLLKVAPGGTPTCRFPVADAGT